MTETSGKRGSPVELPTPSGRPADPCRFSRGRPGRPRAIVAWALLVPSATILAAWAVGTIASDRLYLTQFLSWIPTELAIVASGGLLACALLLRSRSARRVGWVVCIAWACALGWLVLAEWNGLRWLTGTSAGPASTSDLRIVYWNTSAERVRRPAPIADGLDADLFIFANPAMWQPELKRLAADRDSVQRWGSMFLGSRLPILSRGRTSLGLRGVVRGKDPKTDGEAAYAAGWAGFLELDTPAGPLVVWVIDVPSDPRMPRYASAVRARQHITEWRSPDGTRGFPAPDLIVGDFNIPRGSASLEHLSFGLREAHDLIGVGRVASWPRPMPFWHIDLCFVADGVELVRYDLLDVDAAEHLVQVVDITLR